MQMEGTAPHQSLAAKRTLLKHHLRHLQVCAHTVAAATAQCSRHTFVVRLPPCQEETVASAIGLGRLCHFEHL